jgi:ArsR family transcriptional regulator, arsenate/arsenite/antimonite-responsive transcriptional repressor
MEHTTQLFKALGDMTRLRIVALLFFGELCVCDIMACLNLPQSTVSRHLAYLRNAGLVKSRRKQKWMHYRLPSDSDALTRGAVELLKQQLPLHATIEEDQKNLRTYLKEKGTDGCQKGGRGKQAP